MPADPVHLAAGSALVGALMGLWRSRPTSESTEGQGVRRPARRDEEEQD